MKNKTLKNKTLIFFESGQALTKLRVNQRYTRFYWYRLWIVLKSKRVKDECSCYDCNFEHKAKCILWKSPFNHKIDNWRRNICCINKYNKKGWNFNGNKICNGFEFHKNRRR